MPNQYNFVKELSTGVVFFFITFEYAHYFYGNAGICGPCPFHPIGGGI